MYLYLFVFEDSTKRIRFKFLWLSDAIQFVICCDKQLETTVDGVIKSYKYINGKNMLDGKRFFENKECTLGKFGTVRLGTLVLSRRLYKEDLNLHGLLRLRSKKSFASMVALSYLFCSFCNAPVRALIILSYLASSFCSPTLRLVSNSIFVLCDGLNVHQLSVRSTIATSLFRFAIFVLFTRVCSISLYCNAAFFLNSASCPSLLFNASSFLRPMSKTACNFA